MLLQPKNWAVFQHYKDRCPPWIKLHRDILNDRTFMRLPIASKALAPMLWLLASESKDGVFDGSLEELIFRLHITEKDYRDGLKPLIDNGFFANASNTLADCQQFAIPETERETETEREKKAPKVATPDGVSDSVWQDFKAIRKAKRAPITPRVLQSLKAEADKAGWPLEKALAECCVRGWQAFKAEWLAPKTNIVDIARVTVPMSNTPDPALAKIKADEKTTRPPTQAEREMLASLKRKS